MARIPLNRSQTTAVMKRLPINRMVANTVGRSSASVSRIARALLTEPTVPAGVHKEAKVSKVGANYDTDWARTYPARFARLIIRTTIMKPIVDALASPSLEGVDRLIDLDGPVIFAANHRSHADTPLMMTAVPEPWRDRLFIGAAADYWFTNRVLSPFSALVIGAIPVERKKVSRTAIDTSLELLADGWSMLIFPEGARSPDGWAREFTSGAAFLAIKAGVPVVPVYLLGTDEVWSKGNRLPRRAQATVVFGSPITPTADDDNRSFAQRIQNAVALLADEHSSDWWQARRRAAKGVTPSLQGPPADSWRRAWARSGPERRSGRRSWPAV
jgi:1-acyl-sn-glycerol-3-phosphate acyltransferase